MAFSHKCGIVRAGGFRYNGLLERFSLTGAVDGKAAASGELVRANLLQPSPQK